MDKEESEFKFGGVTDEVVTLETLKSEGSSLLKIFQTHAIQLVRKKGGYQDVTYLFLDFYYLYKNFNYFF